MKHYVWPKWSGQVIKSNSIKNVPGNDDCNYNWLAEILRNIAKFPWYSYHIYGLLSSKFAVMQYLATMHLSKIYKIFIE